MKVRELDRPRRRWEGNIKMDLKGCEVYDGIQCRALLNKVLIFFGRLNFMLLTPCIFLYSIFLKEQQNAILKISFVPSE
jgi:hypothetical protein